MTRRIHSSMKEANDIHRVRSLDVEDEMTADPIPAVPLADLLARVSAVGRRGNPLDRRSKFSDIDLRLFDVPPLSGVVPDL